jgi:hypothetical protein
MALLNKFYLIDPNVKVPSSTLKRRRKRQREQFSLKEPIDNRDKNVRNY